MKNIDFFNLKLNHIRIFIEAVESGNFSAAAKNLYVTQPMVTKTIQSLERELDIILFHRHGAKLELTPAGRELYIQWKNILHYFESSVEDAYAQQEGKGRRIVIGTYYLMPNRIQKELVKEIKSIQDDTRVHFECYTMAKSWEKVLSGELDATLVSGHILPNVKPAGIDWKPLCTSKWAVLMSRDNPLSQKKTIKIEDLKNEKFIEFSSDTDQRHLLKLNQMAAKAGFVPEIFCYVPDEASFLLNLRMNNGVVIADTRTLEEDETIKIYPLEEDTNTCIVWRKECEGKELTKIIGVFERIFQKY